MVSEIIINEDLEEKINYPDGALATCNSTYIIE